MERKKKSRGGQPYDHLLPPPPSLLPPPRTEALASAVPTGSTCPPPGPEEAAPREAAGGGRAAARGTRCAQASPAPALRADGQGRRDGAAPPGEARRGPAHFDCGAAGGEGGKRVKGADAPGLVLPAAAAACSGMKIWLSLSLFLSLSLSPLPPRLPPSLPALLADPRAGPAPCEGRGAGGGVGGGPGKGKEEKGRGRAPCPHAETRDSTASHPHPPLLSLRAGAQGGGEAAAVVVSAVCSWVSLPAPCTALGLSGTGNVAVWLCGGGRVGSARASARAAVQAPFPPCPHQPSEAAAAEWGAGIC